MKLRKHIPKLSRIVIKVGSNVVTKQSLLDINQIRTISKDISALRSKGIQVILVSSGSITAGKSIFKTENIDIKTQQALSSIGQPILMNEYSKQFKKYDLSTAQLLLTQEDFKSKKRFINLRASINTLLENNIIPILNENDAVSFEEITVGDNDHLAATAASLLSADLLLLITSANGLYTDDPTLAHSKRIPVVKDEVLSVKTKTKTQVGRGGMQSKLKAVQKVTALGVTCIISSKDEKDFIISALTKDIGTIFIPTSKRLNDKKTWISSIVKNNNGIHIDDGAYKALLRNSSLLPKGILKTKGSFLRGDCIEIIYKSIVVAFGVTEYSKSQVESIKGVHSKDIASKIKIKITDEVIHKDNLILKGQK